jgi:hypothetical protein
MGFFTDIRKKASDLAVEVLPDDGKEMLSHLKQGNLDGVKKVSLWLCHSPTAAGLISFWSKQLRHIAETSVE